MSDISSSTPSRSSRSQKSSISRKRGGSSTKSRRRRQEQSSSNFLAMEDLLAMQCSPIENTNKTFRSHSRRNTKVFDDGQKSIQVITSKLNDFLNCTGAFAAGMMAPHDDDDSIFDDADSFCIPQSTRSYDPFEEAGFEIEEHVTLKMAYDLYRV